MHSTVQFREESHMRKRRIPALLLSCAMLFTMSPRIESAALDRTGTAEGEGVVFAASSWQPKPTKTISATSGFPVTLKNGDVLQINGPINYTAAVGKSPITLAAGANAKIIINGSVTLHGANALGMTGATAAINVPTGAKLTIYSAHDEELSASKGAPKDTLTVTGGNAAAGADGTEGEKRITETENIQQKTTEWFTGSGGNGGGGAAAAIGGNGGAGGKGAAGGRSPQNIMERTWSGINFYDVDDRRGANGSDGSTGSVGGGAGTIYISGRLTLNATGGSAAAGGDGKKGSSGYAYITELDRMIGGTGGGGGGGGGCAARAIGAGGAGGSGGGSGGHPGSDQKGNVQGPGGGGGGGGWPNGGGGGGGGAECTKALDERDNTSQGGSGGKGGSAGSSGRSGSAGTQTGTNGHGYNDARPGNGGNGGSGVQGVGGNGGSGGTEKDDKNYNGGNGGAGGKAVNLQAWHTAGSLIFSTAANLNVATYGDGGGKGTVTTLSPYIIYDLMDCKVNLSSSTYTYTGKQLRPTVQSVTYSASSDRDGKAVSAGTRTLASGNYTVVYGANIHCPSGTVSVTGRQDGSRTTVQTNGAVIGTNDVTFTINKAQLTAPIQMSTTAPYPNQAVTATLNTYSSATAGTGRLSALLRESSQKTEGPQVTWSLSSSAGKLTQTNGLQAQFMFARAATMRVTAVLRDMNDFEDCTVTYSLTAQTPQAWTPTLSTDTPHPRVAVRVVLPTGIGSAAYQWYADDTAISGATAQSYTPTAADIGKTLSVTVTPSADSGYAASRVTAANAVEAHKYNTNGFCTVCDEYQPATPADGIYQIENGGQMFWFAALVNGDGTHAVFAAKDQAASAMLTKDIDLENREWKPVGSYGNDYTGTFDGQKHTVSGLSVTKTNSYTGFFGRTTGTIRDFTIEGAITLSAAGIRIGGAVGAAYGGTVRGICSRVTIRDAGFESRHIGGVVGGVDNPVTAIEQCLFEGSLQIAASIDCIGGILGYSNGGARIRNCANLGTVTTDTVDAYTGGILGYVNNAAPSIQNCYNYGAVQNSGKYCGAIVGWMRNHTAAKYTDNYYLSGSAPAAFGTGSYATTAKVYAKDAAAFASGEVCYLINGSSSASDVVWRQDVDNGNTPYDLYPLFDGGIVLQNREHHDCTTGSYTYTYSNMASSEDHIHHRYVNGFCACCDALEPAVQKNRVYAIENGGQLFWFAAQIDNGAIPLDSAAALAADADLEGSRDGDPADYAGITKSRNFPGVGTSANPYAGNFAGGGHTVSDLYIHRENKTDAVIEGVGLFGYVNNATIAGLTVSGSITLHRETTDGEIKRIGGVVGMAIGSHLSELISYVRITGSGAVYNHVGGVVGSAMDTSDVFKCMYFGAIELEATTDCVGGVVGYINTTSIRYCGNVGTVKSGSANGYVGGVLGYLNNSGGSVRNSYSYGAVQNGGGRYCGAVIGCLRSHKAANFTDNYYLVGSAPVDIDIDSKYAQDVAATEKDSAAFASGEVCYLADSKTSTGDKALWKQDVDNGNTPYDKYPVFDADAIYLRSDYTYSNFPEKISVTIRWGAMEFDYQGGRWDPDTHSYSGGWTATATDGDKLTVQNDSNVALNVALTFTADETMTAYDLTGSFGGVAVGTNRVARDTGITARLSLRSLAPESIRDSGKKKLGDITVRLTTIGGSN